MAKGFLVVADIRGAHPKQTEYPLLEEDLLLKYEDGTFSKVCPGLGIHGFVLTPEQEATLKPVEYKQHGLNYKILSDS